MMQTAEEKRQSACDAARKWRQSHPEAVKKQKARYYERHSERLRAKMNPANLARAQALRRTALDALGGCCVRCGFDDPRALQIDHVHGGGAKERAASRSPDAFHKKVIADQSGYQCLCANCNWIKRIENEEHRWGYAKANAVGTITED